MILPSPQNIARGRDLANTVLTAGETYADRAAERDALAEAAAIAFEEVEREGIEKAAAEIDRLTLALTEMTKERDCFAGILEILAGDVEAHARQRPDCTFGFDRSLNLARAVLAGLDRKKPT